MLGSKTYAGNLCYRFLTYSAFSDFHSYKPPLTSNSFPGHSAGLNCVMSSIRKLFLNPFAVLSTADF